MCLLIATINSSEEEENSSMPGKSEDVEAAKRIFGDPMLILLVLAVVVPVIVRFLRNALSETRLPPGPMGLPLVGYLPFVKHKKSGTGGHNPGSLYSVIKKLGEKYGSIFRLQLGSYELTVLNSRDVIQEVTQACGDSIKPLEQVAGPADKTASGKGQQAAQQQQLLAPFGEIEDFKSRFYREVAEMATDVFKGSPKIKLNQVPRKTQDWLERRLQETSINPAVEVDSAVIPYTTGFLSHLLLGASADPKDGYVSEIARLYTEKAGIEENLALSRYLPLFRYIHKKELKELGEIRSQFRAHIRQQIDDNLSLLDQYEYELGRDDVSDIVSALEVAASEAPEAARNQLGFSSAQGDIQRLSIDLFEAVLGKSVQFLAETICLLAEHTESYERAWARTQDRSAKIILKFDFAQSLVLEALRYGSMLGLGNPRRVTKTTPLPETIGGGSVPGQGYILAENSHVLPSYASIHFDPLLFPQPDTFDPTRFLDEESGKFADASEQFAHLVQLSLGERSVVEKLAIGILPALVLGVIQRFKITDSGFSDKAGPPGKWQLCFQPR